MKSFTAICFILLLPSLVSADTSDYIWNQQFEKKMALAEQGDSKAQYDIGNMYLKGQGIDPSAKDAFSWFRKAANQGSERAAYKLGYLYLRGDGVGKSSGKAFTWISKAARKKYTPAMFYLGKLYSSGIGTGRDYDKALVWYKKADKKGYHAAKREIDRVQALIIAIAGSAPAPRAAARPKPRVVAARPKPRVVAANPKPAAVTKPRKVRAQGKQARFAKARLFNSEWKLNGKPAAYFPSDVSQCQLGANEIICVSDELEREEKYGVVTYTLNTSIFDFTNKSEFKVESQEDVSLIFPHDPDDPDLVIPIDYGVQQKQTMRCTIKGNSVTCTRGKTRLTFKKS